MPAPIDISIWQSNWVVNKINQQKTDFKSVLVDFRFGYWGTAILAIIFLLLGALTLQQPESLSPKAATFTNQLLVSFKQIFGTFGGVLVGIAAVATMLSTTITVLDGYSQSVGKALSVIRQKPFTQTTYHTWIASLILGTFAILSFFGKSMIQLVDLATILSFLSAPFFGIVNLIVNKRFIPKQYQLSSFSFLVGVIGSISLLLFSFYYIYIKLFL